MNKVYSVISGAISFWIPATVMVYVYIRWIRHSRKVSQDWVRFWPKSCSVLKIFNIIYGGRLLVVLVSFVSSSTNFVQNFLKFEWCVSASFANSYAFTKIFQVLGSKISLGTESDSALFQSAQSPTRVELASADLSLFFYRLCAMLYSAQFFILHKSYENEIICKSILAC